MINAIYTDDENKLNMIEFNEIVYSITQEDKTIKPIGNTVFIQELFTKNEYIEVIKDSIGFIVSIRFDNSLMNEFRI